MLVASPGTSWARTIEDYLRAFRDLRPEVRRNALKSEELAKCYSEDLEEGSCPWSEEDFTRLTSALIRLLSDPEPDIRKDAAQYLISSTDARATGPLARLLTDPDDGVRAVAASAFLHIWVHDDAIVGRLEKLLLDRSENVRAGAATSLVLNGTVTSLERLKEAHDRETNQDVKKLLADAIKQLAKRTGK